MGAAMRMGAELSGGEFPISVFPHKIQRIITELHASQGYPIDYIAAAMLGIGGEHRQLASCTGEAWLGGESYSIYGTHRTTRSKQKPPIEFRISTIYRTRLPMQQRV